VLAIASAQWECLLLAEIPGTGLLFGLMLAAAIAGGYIASLLRIPRVVGYLFAGVALREGLRQLLHIEAGGTSAEELDAAADPLNAIKDLGLGIILFSIGAVFESRHLAAVGKRAVRIAMAESGLTFALVFVGTLVTGLLISGGESLATVLAFSLLLGSAAIATAPAATLSVLTEYDAKGPNTDTILSLTGVNNVVCIVLFHLGFSLLAAGGLLGNVDLPAGRLLLDLLTTTLGSIAMGVVLGFVVSLLHARLQLAETLLILVAVLVVVGAGEEWLLGQHGISYSFLLVAIAMGATFANTAIDPDRLDTALQTMSRPVLVGFFVIAGFHLQFGDFVGLGAVGAAYVVCRLCGKVLGSYLGIRWAKASGELRPYLGTALLCQAAVVIGLADYVAAHWHDPWAGRFVLVVLGSVVLFEMCGPLLVKNTVKSAGEVKAITLIRRRAAPRSGGSSTLAITWYALLRSLGLGRRAGPRTDKPLCVRHIMRTNVKCVRAEADFDEVLHFAEKSRFNHFPVVDAEQRLVGVIHFSDIRGIIYDPFMSQLMTAMDLSNPHRGIAADLSMAEALEVFKKGDTGSLPVVEAADSPKVVGILEQRDLLRAVHLHGDQQGPGAET